MEAGPDDRGLPEILQLDRWMELLESGYDWDYPVEPQENGNSFMRHARAKVMGGCSSHNSCIAFWAPAKTWTSGSPNTAPRAGTPRRPGRSTSGWKPTRTPARTRRTTATQAPCT